MIRARAFLIGLATSSSAIAAVPYTFSAGQPARASEVNANFKNLDDRVKAVESSSGGGGGSSSVIYAHALTYTPASATVGQEITIEGVKYRILRVPVKTPDGKVYALTYPAQVRDGGASLNASARYYVNTAVYIYHVKYEFTPTTTISGFPAQLSVNDNWSFTYAGNSSTAGGSSGYWDQRAAVQFDAQTSATIDLDGYRVSINYSASEKQKEQTGISNSISDFTGVDLTNVKDSTTALGALDQLVDYIKVERLP